MKVFRITRVQHWVDYPFLGVSIGKSVGRERILILPLSSALECCGSTVGAAAPGGSQRGFGISGMRREQEAGAGQSGEERAGRDPINP